MDKVIHEIPPVFDKNSGILILGSFPSVKSREGRFFYNHPQNRFWKVVAALCGACRCSKNMWEGYVPETIEEKKKFLLDHGIAVWDVIASCEIQGSSDSSIKNVVPNDLSVILDAADIEKICCNGGTSYKLYGQYLEEKTGRPAVKLPSTSPANAAYSLERLAVLWKESIDGK